MKEYFLAYFSYLDDWKLLNDAECGRLFRAATEYAMSGKIVELKGNERFLFNTVKSQIDRDNAKYAEKCIKNKKSIEKRWKNRINTGSDTNVYERIFSDTKNTKEKEKEKTKENNDIISPYGRNNILVKSQKIGTRLSGTNPRKTGTSPRQLGVFPKQLIEQKFKKFWDVYPKKVAKQAALKAFIKISNLEATHEKILEGVERWKASNQWKDPQFIPYPTSFLNGRRWEDEITAFGGEKNNGLQSNNSEDQVCTEFSEGDEPPEGLYD